MEQRKRWRIVGVAVVAGMVGYLIGPPIVNAVTGNVVIKTGNTGKEARVQQRNLWVDATGSIVTNFAGVYDMIGEGTGNEAVCSSDTILAGVAVEGTTGTFTVTVTGDDIDQSDTLANDTMWKGSADANEHLYDTFFDGGVFVGTSTSVAVSGGGTGQWFLYGFCSGSASTAPRDIRGVSR